ncbi:hypothetical protein C8R46DRAFT_280169 [Mycena filopes]|nr:hypothetical protein C8R46DRAFT_280169 [Mycena filopes]
MARCVLCFTLLTTTPLRPLSFTCCSCPPMSSSMLCITDVSTPARTWYALSSDTRIGTKPVFQPCIVRVAASLPPLSLSACRHHSPHADAPGSRALSPSRPTTTLNALAAFVSASTATLVGRTRRCAGGMRVVGARGG